MWSDLMMSMLRRVVLSDSQLKRVDLGTPSLLEIEPRLQPLARKVMNAFLRSSFTEGREGREAGGGSSTTPQPIPAGLVFWSLSTVELGLVDSEDRPAFRIGWVRSEDFMDGTDGAEQGPAEAGTTSGVGT